MKALLIRVTFFLSCSNLSSIAHCLLVTFIQNVNIENKQKKKIRALRNLGFHKEKFAVVVHQQFKSHDQNEREKMGDLKIMREKVLKMGKNDVFRHSL